jgi:hypothetical protein
MISSYMHEYFRRFFQKKEPSVRRISLEEFERLYGSLPPDQVVRFDADETESLSNLAARQGEQIPDTLDRIRHTQSALAGTLLEFGKVKNLEEGLERAEQMIKINPDATVTYTREFLNVEYLRNK